jgi:hypothetical protein
MQGTTKICGTSHEEEEEEEEGVWGVEVQLQYS